MYVISARMSGLRLLARAKSRPVNASAVRHVLAGSGHAVEPHTMRNGEVRTEHFGQLAERIREMQSELSLSITAWIML